jgi:hypothetical protein
MLLQSDGCSAWIRDAAAKSPIVIDQHFSLPQISQLPRGAAQIDEWVLNPSPINPLATLSSCCVLVDERRCRAYATVEASNHCSTVCQQPLESIWWQDAHTELHDPREPECSQCLRLRPQRRGSERAANREKKDSQHDVCEKQVIGC